MDTSREEDDPPIKLPNASTIHDNQVGYLPLPSLISKVGRKTRILSDLKYENLISLGQLDDDGCTFHGDAISLEIEKDSSLILTGKRNHIDGIYDIPIYKDGITANNDKPQKLSALYHIALQISTHCYHTINFEQPK